MYHEPRLHDHHRPFPVALVIDGELCHVICPPKPLQWHDSMVRLQSPSHILFLPESRAFVDFELGKAFQGELTRMLSPA